MLMKTTAKNKVYKAIYASETIGLTKIIKYKLERVVRVEPTAGLTRYRLITDNGEGYYAPSSRSDNAVVLTPDVVEAINNGTKAFYAHRKDV